MEIKDLTSSEVKMDAVRGGLSYIVPAFGNSASNYSSNGPVVSLVGVGTKNTNNSSFSITNGVGQQNVTDQKAGVSVDHKWDSSTVFTASQLNIGGLFGGLV